MKIRTGFVSNSSTSSFVCEICGAVESGMDASPEELGFVQCQNEHIICEDEALDGWRMLVEDDENLTPEQFEAINNYGRTMSEEFCPICQFEVASNKDIDLYLRKKFPQYTYEDAFAKVKEINKRRKKLYPNEYLTYVYDLTGLNENKVLAEIKELSGGSYSTFHKILCSY